MPHTLPTHYGLWLSANGYRSEPRAPHRSHIRTYMHAAKRTDARTLQPRTLHPRHNALVHVLANKKGRRDGHRDLTPL